MSTEQSIQVSYLIYLDSNFLPAKWESDYLSGALCFHTNLKKNTFSDTQLVVKSFYLLRQ